MIAQTKYQKGRSHEPTSEIYQARPETSVAMVITYNGHTVTLPSIVTAALFVVETFGKIILLIFALAFFALRVLIDLLWG